MKAGEEAVARLADEIEAAAFKDFFAAAPEPLGIRLGLEVKEIAGATLLLARSIPQPIFNRVIGFGVREPAREADLDAIIATYRKAGRTNWWIHWTPTARPDAIPRWLERRGFAPPQRRAWAKMERGVEPLPAFDTALEIRPVEAGEENGVAVAICSAFGLPDPFVPWIAGLAQRPHWRLFGAFADGTAVGGGCLFVHDDGGWLGLGGMREGHRGRGAHRALMAARIRAAISAGCAAVFTETGEPVGDEPNPSLANMQRCGFRQVSSRLNYAAPAA